MSAYESLAYIVEGCRESLKTPENIRSTQLRKFMAMVTQVRNILLFTGLGGKKGRLGHLKNTYQKIRIQN